MKDVGDVDVGDVDVGDVMRVLLLMKDVAVVDVGVKQVRPPSLTFALTV